MNNQIINMITPSESHLPPSRRTWARLIRLEGGFEALELRDPNHGTGDPQGSPRHQYMVHRKRLWRRILPPKPLHDDSPDEASSGWSLVAPNGANLVWQWADIPAYPTEPIRSGDGDYVVPAADPFDAWKDVTDIPCPECDQTIVWYEAGYVPGYRVCAPQTDDGYDMSAIRHRWIARPALDASWLLRA